MRLKESWEKGELENTSAASYIFQISCNTRIRGLYLYGEPNGKIMIWRVKTVPYLLNIQYNYLRSILIFVKGAYYDF